MNAIATNNQNGLQVALKGLKRDLQLNHRVYAALLKADDRDVIRFMAEVAQAVSNNPKLLEANRGSLLQSIGEAASMGLSVNPNLGEAYLIPRWSGKMQTNLVTFQRGYKGLVKLAFRSNLIDSIYTDVVYRGEHYIRTGGTDPKIDHIPDDTDGHRSGEFDDIVAAYAVVWVKGSSKPIFRAVSRVDLEKARAVNWNTKKNQPSDAWLGHPEAMSRKTAMIRVASLLPRDDKLRDFHTAVERDLMIEADKDVPALPELANLRVGAPEPDDLSAMESLGQGSDAPTDDDLAGME